MMWIVLGKCILYDSIDLGDSPIDWKTKGLNGNQGNEVEHCIP